MLAPNEKRARTICESPSTITACGETRNAADQNRGRYRMRARLLGVATATGFVITPLWTALAQTTPPTAPAAAAPPVVTIPAPAPTTCTGTPDPYKNYACLDTYLGTGVFERFYNYYRLEWGESGPPTDPGAPPQRRAGWPDAPETTPPIPFTEWPYGGTTPIGVTRTGSVDSPLMVAIANTPVGKALNDAGIQIYGWVNPGFNFSSNTVRLMTVIEERS
jgi:hypothetical protein